MPEQGRRFVERLLPADHDGGRWVDQAGRAAPANATAKLADAIRATGIADIRARCSW